MHVVLYQPEIPQNTGNIIRLCANTGAKLVVIEPLGFELSDRTLKRAGLDYHAHVSISRYASWEDFLAYLGDMPLLLLSTKAQRRYTAVDYHPDTHIVFGPESRGLPEEFLADTYGRTCRLPMAAHSRSLNLANTVAIVLYEGLRQQGFAGLV